MMVKFYANFLQLLLLESHIAGGNDFILLQPTEFWIRVGDYID